MAAADSTGSPESGDDAELLVEDITTGPHASGFGTLGDGRAFSFRVHRGRFTVEVYRRGLTGPVPMPEDVVGAAERDLNDFAELDLDDEASLIAVLREVAVAAASDSRH